MGCAGFDFEKLDCVFGDERGSEAHTLGPAHISTRSGVIRGVFRFQVSDDASTSEGLPTFLDPGVNQHEPHAFFTL